MRWIGLAARVVAGVLALAAVTAAGGFLFLQTGAGKSWATEAINRSLAGEARIAGLAGSLPFHPRVAEIDLLDAAGSWATLRDASVDLAPLDLLRRRATIPAIRAASAEVSRAPVSGPTASPSPGPPTLPTIPRLPVNVDLQHIDIADIRLDAPVLGEAVGLAFHASATVIGGRADVAFALTRSDGQTGEAQGRMQLAGNPAALGLHLHVAEPEGIVLQRLLAWPERLPLAIALDGEGPLSGWEGKLAGRAGSAGTLDATFDLARHGEGLHAAATGALQAAPLYPPAVAPLLGARVGFRLAATARPDGGVAVEDLALDAGGFHLSASGTYADGGAVAASLRLDLPDLAKLQAMLGQPAGGAMDATATVSGTTARPALAATLAGHALQLAGNRVDTASATITATPSAPLDDPAARLGLAASGRLEGIAIGGKALPDDLGAGVDWHLAATSDMAGQSVSLTGLSISEPGLALTGTGAADRVRNQANGQFHLSIEKLARFSDLVGQPIAGRLDADVGLSSGGPPAVAATLRAAIAGLATGMPAADALLGRQVALRASASRGADGALAIDAASLDGANLKASGRGDVSADFQRLNATFSLTANDLAALAKAGMPARGRLRIDGQVAGGPAAPVLDATIAATDAGWQTVRLDRVTMQAHATAGNAPTLRLTGTFSAGDVAGRLATDAALDPSREALRIDRLHIDAGGGAVDATLRTTLGSYLTNGKIALHLPDLAPWSRLAGTPLAGRFDLDATLAARAGQSVSFVASGAGIRAGGGTGGSLGKLSARGDLTNVLRAPAGTAELALADAASGSSRFDRLHLSLHSTGPERMGVEATLAATAGKPITLAASGAVGLDRGAVQASLDRLDGKIASYPLTLEHPVAFSSTPQEMTVSALALTLGHGRIEGRAAVGGDRVALTVAATQLPVALAGEFIGNEHLGGFIDAKIDLAGPPGRLEGHAILALHQVSFAAEHRYGAPTLGLTATATLQPDGVAVEGELDGPSGKALGFTGSVPAEISARPFAIALPTDRPVVAKIDGDGDLKDYADLLPTGGGGRLAGKFHLHLAVAGTLAAPDLSGGVTLADGRYEALASGTILDHVGIDIAGNHDQVVLRHFGATDGASGRIDVVGGITMTNPSGPALHLQATIDKFHAVRRDDASGTVSGQASVEGMLAAPRLSARLAIDESDLAIPDKLPPSAQALDVTVIDSKTGQVIAKPQPPQPAAVARVALDVDIDIPGQTFVRGRGLDSEWKGRVHVGGTSDAPSVTGSLQVVHGTFAFLGQTLTLTRGTITFIGANRITPRLDFVAEASASGITAEVRVTGEPSDLKIALSSTPALPEDEILSRLLFGTDMQHITAAQGLELAQGVQALAGGGPDILGRVRSTLGLDVLSVGSGNPNGTAPLDTSLVGGTGTAAGTTASSSSATANTSLSAGKYIAKGVYVGVQQDMSGDTKSTVNVEVFPNVTVSSSVGVRGGDDIGLNWRMDY